MESELHQFSMGERDRRYKKIRELMRKQGLDALIMAGGDGVGWSMGNGGDIRYISLANVTNSWGFVVFPLEGEPSMFVRSNPEGIRSLGWVANVKGVKPSRGIPTGMFANDDEYHAFIVDAVKELKLNEGTIGLVKYDKFPAPVYESLVKAFPKATFKNGSELMRQVRMVKSTEELRRVFRTAELADIAAQTCIETIEPGVTKGEVAAAQYHAMAKNDIEHWILGEIRANEIFKSGDRTNSAGFVVEMSARGGYWNHTPYRTICLGEPSRAYRDAYEKCIEMMKVMVKEERPGNTVADVCKAVIDAGGNPWGHGMGLDMCEEPFFNLDWPVSRDIEIKPGMVNSVQPSVKVKGESATIFDTVYVTETGARQLSKIPPDLIVK